jgi:hypothetical protein
VCFWGMVMFIIIFYLWVVHIEARGSIHGDGSSLEVSLR